MKKATIFIYFLLVCFCGFAQGISCATAINLPMDGVLRNYNSSATTGLNVLCTPSSTSPVTWFKFSTNSAGVCPLMSITASDSLACEVGFYTSCSSMLTSSSMCFYSGYGLWAPNENLVLSANTIYYLRIKTTSLCNLSIAAQSYASPNDVCSGAVSIDAVPISDNNACDHGGPGIIPSQLCALTLENTAWYQFYVNQTGYSIITLTNIHCDNGATNNNNGFQIGFFTGTCSALQWVNCQNGSGPTVQATTALLQAGTKVYVAIDGVSGSNCSYSIAGLNITGVLEENVRYFSAWKSGHINIIQWSIGSEVPGRYVIERSEEGRTFSQIGFLDTRIENPQHVIYSFADEHPVRLSYYRLRKYTENGKTSLSNICRVLRDNLQITRSLAYLTLQGKLHLEFSNLQDGNYNYLIRNVEGQTLNKGIAKLINNKCELTPLSLQPKGFYVVSLTTRSGIESVTFINK